MGFSIEFFVGLFPELLPGAWISLQLLMIAAVAGNILALCVAGARLSGVAWLRYVADGYSTLIRGTPLLVQIYVLYYGVGFVLAQMPEVRASIFWPLLREGFWYAAVSLAISVSAYSGEVFTGAMRAVAPGLVEAGTALGLSRFAIIRFIVLPTAVRICLPTLGGETIALLKSTALASTITVLDLLGTADSIRSQTFRTYEPLLAAALMYAAIAFLITHVFRRLERHLSRHLEVGSASS